MTWRTAEILPEIAVGQVHVWTARPPGRNEGERSPSVLCATERDRARRFRRQADRRRFVFRRTILRTILAGYLDVGPDELPLVDGERGKPRLEHGGGIPDVRFNLSQSGSLTLVAVARGREIGVDVERLRPLEDALPIAQRFFAPRERAWIEGQPERRLPEAFFECWTKKEAYLKGLGTGLWEGLDRFVVPLGSDGVVSELTAGATDRAGRWRLYSLTPEPGYVGALAVAGSSVRIRAMTWGAAERPGDAADG